jgi:histone H1/5
MSDAAAAPAPAPAKATKAPKASKAKKAAKPKVAAAHPPYAAMVKTAIKTLGDKKGSSRQAILKAVVANNKVDAAKAGVRVKLALRKMIADKAVVTAAVAGKKGSGCYKLPAKEPKVKAAAKPKAKKPKAAKKAAAKKPKAAKKPAAKKAAKLKAAKKPAAKKAAKPKAAKKA